MRLYLRRCVNGETHLGAHHTKSTMEVAVGRDIQAGLLQAEFTYVYEMLRWRTTAPIVERQSDGAK